MDSNLECSPPQNEADCDQDGQVDVYAQSMNVTPKWVLLLHGGYE
ncbi:hypothetical protein [Paenibacillus sp. sptzw28]|nr:hypothetical protein [Paenibacillus sp. sptzw28]